MVQEVVDEVVVVVVSLAVIVDLQAVFPTTSFARAISRENHVHMSKYIWTSDLLISVLCGSSLW